MEVRFMNEINLNNAVERSFYGISGAYAIALQKAGYSIYYDEVDNTYTIYDDRDNDIEELTYEELQIR